jgi:DoxX-like family
MKDKIIYGISTILFCSIMLFSATMYFTKYELVKGFFIALGYPVYLIYPLATAKILGVIAIASRKSALLKDWAYAGFFFDALLATTAHLMHKDGGYLMALVALLMVMISRIYDRIVFPKN